MKIFKEVHVHVSERARVHNRIAWGFLTLILILGIVIAFLYWSWKRNIRESADEALKIAVQTVAKRLSEEASDGRLTQEEINGIALRSGIDRVVVSEQENAIIIQGEVHGISPGPFLGGTVSSGCRLFLIWKPIVPYAKVDVQKIDKC